MLDQMTTSYAYNSDGTVAAITKTDGRLTWVKTFSYANGVMVSSTKWVRQP